MPTHQCLPICTPSLQIHTRRPTKFLTTFRRCLYILLHHFMLTVRGLLTGFSFDVRVLFAARSSTSLWFSPTSSQFNFAGELYLPSRALCWYGFPVEQLNQFDGAIHESENIGWEWYCGRICADHLEIATKFDSGIYDDEKNVQAIYFKTAIARMVEGLQAKAIEVEWLT